MRKMTHFNAIERKWLEEGAVRPQPPANVTSNLPVYGFIGAAVVVVVAVIVDDDGIFFAFNSI